MSNCLIIEGFDFLLLSIWRTSYNDQHQWVLLLNIVSEQTIPEDLVVNIVRNVFIDSPASPPLPYNFNKPNPALEGQIGVPPIVDKILGIV